MAPAAGNLRFWTGLLFLSRASVGSDADGHTTVGYLWVEHRSARGWFDRNSPHRARGLLGDRKLEDPPRDFPTGLGIDPRDLSAAHHFLQVSRRILHHHCVAFVLPTPS